MNKIRLFVVTVIIQYLDNVHIGILVKYGDGNKAKNEQILTSASFMSIVVMVRSHLDLHSLADLFLLLYFHRLSF